MISESYGAGGMYGSAIMAIPAHCNFTTNERNDGVYFIVDYRKAPDVKQPS